MATKPVRIDKIIVPRGRRPLGQIGELKKSIAEIGLLHPIVVTREMRLVAGLHRLRACQALGWKTIPATVVDLRKIGAELAELDENLARRELTVLGRSEALARRKEIHELLHPETRRGVIGGRKSGENRSGKKPTSETISFVQQASRMTHLSPRTLQHEVQIAQAIPEDVRLLLHGSRLENRKVELLRLARLPHDEQREVVLRVVRGEVKSVKAAESALVEERLRAGREPFPKGRFEVIVVDPPWVISDLRTGYPEMTVAEIKNVPVQRLAADNAVVLLWVVPSMIEEGLQVLKSWNMRQVAFIVWQKTSARPGRYVMSRAELCLLGIRGKPLVLKPRLNVITAAARQHSRKPDEFYDLVADSFGGRKLDMFARESRDGWETWGPERMKFDGEPKRRRSSAEE
jgi:ParB family chromosome partitioning protein